MQLCGFDVGLNHRFFLIAGTCSIESLQMSLDVAGQLKEVCTALGIPLIYKGSFDKANRSSGTSQRGVGLDAGLKILDEVRRQLHLPILTDVHDEVAGRPGGQRGRCAADARLPVPPDGLHPRRGPVGQAGRTSRRGSSWRPGT